MSTETPSQKPASTISNFDESSLELLTINEKVARKYHENLKRVLLDPDHPITQYVRGAERQLTDEQIEEWQLGFAPNEWRHITTPLLEQGAFNPAVTGGLCVEDGDRKYDFFRDRLMIPLFDEARNVIGFTGRSLSDQPPKYLNTKETPVFRKSEVLYGIHLAKRAILRTKHLVLTEGNFDVITLHRYGLIEAVGKGGTALTAEQLGAICRLAESVTLIYDVDPNGSGQLALERDCEKLLEAGLRVKVLELAPAENGGKIDADSWGRQFMQQAEKPGRNALVRHVDKYAEDGMIWLAGRWSTIDNLDTLIEKERRVVELLAKISDEERQNKLIRRLATIFDREAKDITRQLRKVKSEIQRAEQDASYTESEAKDLRTDSVWYRNWDTTMMVKGGRGFNVVANNFHLFIKYRTKDEEENLTWILEIKPAGGDSIFIEVCHDDFTSASRLKKIITGNLYSLKASDNELSEIQAFLFDQTKFAQAIKINRYGYHPDSGVFFFANKAVNGKLLEPDEFGMVHVQKNHQPMVLSMPQQKKGKLHRFTLTDTRVSVDEFFRLYTAAHLYENAIIPFCFYLMSLFRDLALRHKNFSPILFLKGGYGTGKSSLVRVLTAAFGTRQEGINLGSKNTEAALVKLMAQASNCFIWMDEFDNELGAVEKLLQAMYDNDGYHRSKDNTSIDTEGISIFQSLALTSNFIPAREVFFSRCVFIPINDKDKSTDQKLAFDQLEKLEESGIGCMTVELLEHRHLVEKNYAAAYEELYHGIVAEFKSEKVPVRFFANMAQLLTASYILASAGKIAITEEQEPAGILKTLIQIGSDNIRRQYRVMSEKTALSVFFEVIQTLFDQHQIQEEIHYDFERVGNENVVRLWVPQLYNLYAEKFRRTYNEKPADKDTIQSELAVLMDCPDWDALKRSIRFRSDGESNSNAGTITRHNCCRVSYDKLREKFGLNLELRKQRSINY